MGGYLSSNREADGPYAFKFSGFTLWLLHANDDIQEAINTMNQNSPAWQAHSTLLYGLQVDEAAAHTRFQRLREAMEASEPLSLRCKGSPFLFGDYSPFQLRVIGVAFEDSPALAAVSRKAAKAFGKAYTPGSHFAHSSMVYDWIGSPRVNETVVATIRQRWPALTHGSQVDVAAIALVAMDDATVGEWRVVDRIELPSDISPAQRSVGL